MLANGLRSYANHTIIHGAGNYLYTKCGKKILDCSSGIGILALGHCHPRINNAIKNQIDKGIHFQQYLGEQDCLKELCSNLSRHTPEGMDRFVFTPSGTEKDNPCACPIP